MSDKMVVLPGERCRKAREAMGWTTAEAAKRMHLSQTYLLALEADDYERLPEATFVKGYLKNYARLLGLPADEVANTFQQMINEDAFDKPLELPSMPNRRGLLARPVVWLLILIVAVIAVVVLWPQGEDEPDAVDGAPLAPLSEDAGQQDPTAGPDAAVVDDAGPESAMADTVGAMDDAETAEAGQAEQEPVEPTPAVEEAAPAIDPDMLAGNGQDRLVMDLNADCWMEIRDANGRVLRQGVKPAGATLRVDGKAPFSLKIGNAAAVSELFLNGEAVTLPTDSPGKVVNLTLP
ncbi:DUF4115 domain-containing protein [Alcanivorax sp. S6407]|uniref:RodZ domain-containing protein n=1 Tax=Alcanivorax sp. S6407 TaxID=2926424 RepID=UPI001FF4539E|nr:RodZ domain-containing protein [Alcanivorax sp. S6407]MCK0153168.1 DUF4115 domain-containing protein [Alcanivorax sp. S6407]